MALIPIQVAVQQPIARVLLPDLKDATLHGAWLNWQTAQDNLGSDYSYAGDDMTPVGAPVHERVGAGFDGVADYLRRAESDWRSGDSAGTITAWIKRDVIGADHAIFGSADEAGTNYRFRFRARDTNVLSVEQRNNDTAREITGSTTLEAGRWYHAVLVSDGSAYALYLDGQAETLVGAVNDGDWLADTDNRDSITIGAGRMNAAFYYFNGQIRDVRYYSEAKTADWVKREYQRGIPDDSLKLHILNDQRDLSRCGGDFVPQADVVVGHGIELDGTGDYLYRSVADWRGGDEQGTIIAWVKCNAIGGNQTIFASDDQATANFRFRFIVSHPGAIQVWARHTNDQVEGSTVLVAGRWYQVALVSDGSQWIMYVNGNIETPNILAGANDGVWLADVANRDNVTIGVERYNAVAGYFNGQIKDIRYYSEAKSAAFVKAYYLKTRRFY